MVQKRRISLIDPGGLHLWGRTGHGRAFSAMYCWNTLCSCTPSRSEWPRGRNKLLDEKWPQRAHDDPGVMLIMYVEQSWARMSLRNISRAHVLPLLKTFFWEAGMMIKQNFEFYGFFYMSWNTHTREECFLDGRSMFRHWNNTRPHKRFFPASSTLLLCLIRHPSCDLCLK